MIGNPEQWAAVDRYIAGHVSASDPVLEAAACASAEAGLPMIAVSPCQGQLLHLLARLQGARHILEIGALGGYSTICLARALPPGGRLVTLELDPAHARVALANIARAGLAELVEMRLGPALDTLPQLAAEHRAPFDVVFIDADKERIPDYFTWAMKLTRRGSLIIVDNVVRKGALIDPADADPGVLGVRRLHEMLASEPRVTATTLQTVGAKGWDGITLALVVADP